MSLSINNQKSAKLALITKLAVAVTFVFALSSCSTSNSTDSAASSESSNSPAASQDAMGYRYWGYSQSSDDGKSWVTAMEGPATTNPKDGSVEGWNYTISAEGVVDPQAPSTAPDFQTLCAGANAEADKKRVGYVIEFGDPAIYPEGDSAPEKSSGCAVLPKDATGIDLLNAVAKVRAGDGGFICGLNGFPSKDCGADPIPVPESMRKK